LANEARFREATLLKESSSPLFDPFFGRRVAPWVRACFQEFWVGIRLKARDTA